jgi:hypothetical protein
VDKQCGTLLGVLFASALVWSSTVAVAADPEVAPPDAVDRQTGRAAPVRPAAEPWNGFDVSNASVAKDKIVAGGPPRDAIRSVDSPEFAAAEAAGRWVAAANTVIGFELDGLARAYPVHLMEYHQIVNDELAGVPVVISYDPLTGLPAAYKRRVDGRTLEFGVSGLVYQSNFLLYDRETHSLWLQWSGEAIAGPMLGKRLERLRVRQEPFAVWHQRYPDTQVLARPLLKQIDYRYSPYSAYWASDKVPFPVDAVDSTYHPKELVLGLRAGDQARAYLGSVILGAGGRVVDEFAGQKVRLAYDTDSGTFTWQVPDGIEITESYWFAWKAFQPDTEIWQGLESAPAPAAEVPAPAKP